MASKETDMSAPCSAQRGPAPPSALRLADPTRPLCVRVLDSTGLLSAKAACLFAASRLASSKTIRLVVLGRYSSQQGNMNSAMERFCRRYTKNRRSMRVETYWTTGGHAKDNVEDDVDNGPGKR